MIRERKVDREYILWLHDSGTVGGIQAAGALLGVGNDLEDEAGLMDADQTWCAFIQAWAISEGLA